METARDKESVLPVQSCKCWSRDRALTEGTWGCAATRVASADPDGLGSTSLGSNHNNCNHTVQPHIHTLQLNHTGIPERTHEVTRSKRGTYIPPNIRTFKPFITESPLAEGLKPTSSECFAVAGGFPWRNQPLGDMRGGWGVSPETPASFGVLLTQDFLLTLALLLRSQVAVLLLQEPHRRPAMLLKMPLVFCKRRRKAYIQLEGVSSFMCFKSTASL